MTHSFATRRFTDGQRGRDLVGVVAEIGEDGSAVPCAHDIEAAAKAREAGKRGGRLAQVQAEGADRGEGGEGVLGIVAAGHGEANGHGFAAASFRYVESDGERFLRSEEHTSELQSLMHTSYAVFCLNNKNNVNLER